MLKNYWKTVAGTLLVLVLGATGYFLWYQHRMAQLHANPVKIYKGTIREATVVPTATPSAEAETVQGGHWPGEEWQSESHTISQQTDTVDTIDTTDDTIDTEEIVPFEPTVEADVPWEETAEAERLLQKMLQDWNDYSQTLLEKYPAIFDPDVLERMAQTQEGRASLKLQAESMIEETLDEFERLFNQLPREYAHKVLDIFEAEYQQNLQGLPPESIHRALGRIRARID